MFMAFEKLACVEREIAYRKRVFPRLIENGKMTQALADKQVAVMVAIADDYREVARLEQADLFATRATKS